MKGNIRCVTDPEVPVIGFVEVATVTRLKRFFPEIEKVYEAEVTGCASTIVQGSEYDNNPDYGYVSYNPMNAESNTYALKRCMDCGRFGSKQKPLGGLPVIYNLVAMKKSMIKQCILSLLCLLWVGQTLLAGELRERVYLQTDKQFYLSGELVWMKFIATDLDQRLSDVSKVGYVELLDSASAVVQARLVLEKGVGDGCLQLPSTLPTGNYRLVAYTRYMRNEGEEVFFEKPLAVVNTFVTNETLLTDTLLPAYSFTRREDPVSVSPDRMTYDTRSGGDPDKRPAPGSTDPIGLYRRD